MAAGIPALSETAIAATSRLLQYIYRRYGRFPAYLPPIHTISGFQAGHLDTEFYDHYYRPEALARPSAGTWPAGTRRAPA